MNDAGSSLHHVFWAKSSEVGGLPLVQHLLDVAAVASELVARLPDATLQRQGRALGVDPGRLGLWSGLLCGLHDLGKATPGFQNKWPPGRSRVEAAGYPFPVGAPDQHDASTEHFAVDALVKRGVSRPAARVLSRAVAAHHGFLIEPVELQHVAAFPLPAPWPSAIDDLASHLFRGVNPGQPVPSLTADKADRAALLLWLAGLCSTCDWIASNAAYFPHGRALTSPSAHFTGSRELARAALDHAGLTAMLRPAVSTPAAALAAALPSGAAPRPLQQVAIESLSGRGPEPQLIVVEAPMGEGKTEAAYAIDAWLRGQGSSRGVYFALPTQATSNALFTRTAAYLGRLYSGDAVELQLAHGAATPELMNTRLQEVGYGDGDASVKASAWFAGHKRTLLASNAVGTVDQSLVAVLNARHHFVRLFGLADRLVVIDEVHAYDVYTGGLIERLVAWLRRSGCTVVLMSATLPKARLFSLARAFGAEGEPPLASYPRITIVGPQGSVATPFPATRDQSVEIDVCSAEPAEIAARASALAAGGAAVLVVANMVSRAQLIFQALDAAVADRRCLFHARFPLEERLAIESAVIGRFGPQGRDREGWVVVATQVAEQSLDVDFDVLISDIAPVDLLLQRCGRMHRHPRPVRPRGADRPRVIIAGLDRRVRVDAAAFHPVYEWLPVLRSADVLAGRNSLYLPADIDQLVQRVYGDQRPDCTDAEFLRAYEAAASDQRELERHQERLAQQAALPLPADWTGLLLNIPQDDDDVANGVSRFGTRLGELSLSVIPVFRQGDEFRVQPDGDGWPVGTPVPAPAARLLGRRYMRLSNPRLVRALLSQPDLAGWNAHAALAGHRALVLDDLGCAQVGGVNLKLDAVLGLVTGRGMSGTSAAGRQDEDHS